MKEISIIMPVYNSEKYLESSINSILNQCGKKEELIVIDDGSTDNSEIICRKYINNSSFKYIKKVNGGVSSARNLGIEQAKGKYITFIDSDDIMRDNVIKEYKRIINDNNYEMIIAGFNEMYVNKLIQKSNFNTKEFSKQNLQKAFFEDNSIGGFVWNKLYSLNIIKSNNIKFDEEINICEDMLFNMNYLKYIEKALITNIVVVDYRIRKNSAARKMTHDKINRLYYCFDQIEKIIDSSNESYKYFKISLLYRYINKIEKKKFNYDYYSLIFSKNISFKKKIKLFIWRKMPLIYNIYITKKTKKYKMYE